MKFLWLFVAIALLLLTSGCAQQSKESTPTMQHTERIIQDCINQSGAADNNSISTINGVRVQLSVKTLVGCKLIICLIDNNAFMGEASRVDVETCRKRILEKKEPVAISVSQTTNQDVPFFITKVNDDTINISNIIVTMSLYDLGNNNIGEHIIVKNYNQNVITIRPGCNYPISEYNSGECIGWSIRSSEPYSFNYRYVNPNSNVSGWVFGLNKDSLKPYNTTLINLSIQINNQEIFIEKDITQLKPFEGYSVDYKFSEYNDYADYIKEDLEKEIGLELKYGGAYGGTEGVEELRKDGKIYFIVYEPGEWDSIRYWAVELNAETGELLEYKEITKGNNEIDIDKLWW